MKHGLAKFLILALLLLGVVSNSFAQVLEICGVKSILKLARALLLVFVLGSSAWAIDTVVCGDDDNNGLQSKLKSVGLTDRDCDGEVGNDCDDSDWKSYPSAYIRVDATNYKQCAASGGAYGADTSATLAECATNYYVDVGTGSNSNACTFASPCLDFSKFNTGGSLASFSGQTCIYLKGTTDMTVAATRTPDGGDSSNRVGFETVVAGPSSSSRNILARYPTSTAKINLTCDAANTCSTIKAGAANWIVRGFEITGGYGTAINATGSDALVVQNYIHDVQGDNNNNLSGVRTGDAVNSVLAHHNIINNIYDPTRTGAADDRQNTTLMTMFFGSGNAFEYNIGGYDHAENTSPFHVQGRGIRQKHGQTNAATTSRNRIKANVLYNVQKDCVHATSPKTDLVGNLCVGTNACFTVSDGGNSNYYIDDIRIQNNTCLTVARGSAIGFGGGAISFDDPSLLLGTPGTGVTVTGNVVNDSAQTTYGGGTYRSMFSIFRPGSDAQFTELITGGKFTINSNYYYNSAISGLTAGMDVYGDNTSTSSGSAVNFANWKGTYSYDSSPLGYEENPAFDTDMRATGTQSTGKGWQAEWPIASSPSSPSSAMGSSRIQLSRGGK